MAWCKTGEAALDYVFKRGDYANNPEVQIPDLILLDLNMPGLDGRQVLRALKADNATKAIPVVVLTTSNDPKDINACYDLGASTYIQKPVSFAGLTEAIGKMKDYWFGVALLPQAAKSNRQTNSP